MKYRTAIPILFILTFLSLFVFALSAAAVPTQEIKAGALAVDLGPAGNIVMARVNGRVWPLTGTTDLAGCRTVGGTKEKKSGKGLSFRRSVTDGKGHTAIVTERFTPTKDSIRWEIEIRSDNAPWSTAIDTSLNYPATKQTQFWTAWSDPEHRADGWRDPLVMEPFTTTNWTYSILSGYSPGLQCNYICMPLLTFAEPAEDTGISLMLSPEDLILDLRLQTTADGAMKFSRSKLRLGGGKTVRMAMDLTAHEADWRGGLRWMVARYPQFFDPPNPDADAMAGCGAYSGDENPIDVAKLRQMAFRINWKLSDDFPYMGMFIPPVKNADERWQRSCGEKAPPNKPGTTSCRQLNDYARYMRTNGFYVLNYFNVTEFGKNMGQKPVRKPGDPELWKDPRAFLKTEFPGAIYLPGAATCYNACVVDVGDPAYQKFILTQAARHNRLIPDSAGICIDRLDCLQYVDGVYNEMGDYGPSLNASALMCLRKPALEWTVGRTLHEPDPDAFMQRHLLLGAYPTAPYPWNNHCLKPEEHGDQVYLDYGPLLDAMRGKKWVLEPHCVEASTPGVKVNLFEVPGGYALPVTFGGTNETAVVQVRGLPGLDHVYCDALQPGIDAALPTAWHFDKENDTLEITVPLARGCAMVTITNSLNHQLKPLLGRYSAR